MDVLPGTCSLSDPLISLKERKQLCDSIASVFARKPCRGWGAILCCYVPFIFDHKGGFINQEGLQVFVLSRGPYPVILTSCLDLQFGPESESTPRRSVRLLYSRSAYNSVFAPLDSEEDAARFMQALDGTFRAKLPGYASTTVVEDFFYDAFIKIGHVCED